MDDVIPIITAGCDLFLSATAGIALLAFAQACRVYAKGPRITAFIPDTKTTSNVTSTPTKLSWPKPGAEPESEPEPTPETPEPAEEIECGACHRIIKSEPIQQIIGSSVMPPSEIYECENCGAKVQVPV